MCCGEHRLRCMQATSCGVSAGSHAPSSSAATHAIITRKLRVAAAQVGGATENERRQPLLQQLIAATLQQAPLGAVAARHRHADVCKVLRLGVIVWHRKEGAHSPRPVAELPACDVRLGTVKAGRTDLLPSTLKEDLRPTHHPVRNGLLSKQPHITLRCTGRPLSRRLQSQQCPGQCVPMHEVGSTPATKLA